ncbi:class I SAM-dependent methyltransferase [Actinopolymorpha sp. B9G3]|uniref:class I SAM-dependent methyltransferase n=1 Tax=Actinopolymorpha sp. B9G3 TaxID=3158970 RepID=UPI0032D9803C
MAWNADLYDAKHSFVTALGAEVVDLLAARPGEHVLDLGCGTGDHVAQLREAGVLAVGADASPAMIERAREKHPGLPVDVADARDLPYDRAFDAVLSNATLHWVQEADQAARSIARALRPRGRFVAEFGGAGNVATIVEAAEELRVDHGVGRSSCPWYFPTIGEYAAVLERSGFEVRQAWLFDRPTRLVGDDGLANWLRMFGQHLVADVSESVGFVESLVARLRPKLHRDGSWWADYRRLRIDAVLVDAVLVDTVLVDAPSAGDPRA